MVCRTLRGSLSFAKTPRREFTGISVSTTTQSGLSFASSTKTPFFSRPKKPAMITGSPFLSPIAYFLPAAMPMFFVTSTPGMLELAPWILTCAAIFFSSAMRNASGMIAAFTMRYSHTSV